MHIPEGSLSPSLDSPNWNRRLIDSTFTPDGAASAVDDGLTSSPTDLTAKGTAQYLDTFPYLGTPYSGYDVPAATAS